MKETLGQRPTSVSERCVFVQVEKSGTRTSSFERIEQFIA